MPYLKRDALCPEPIDCKILTAALDLFVERGFHNISIHEVQKRADVSIGSIYNHFGGKEGVAKGLYHHILNEIDELVDAVMERHNSPKAQYKDIIKELFEHTETHRNIIAFMFHTKHSEFLADEPVFCDSKPFLKIRAIIEQGIIQKEFIKQDLWVLTAVLLGSAYKMIQLRLDGNITQPLPEMVGEFMDTHLKGALM